MVPAQSGDSPPSPLTPTEHVSPCAPLESDNISRIDLEDRTVPIAPATAPLLPHISPGAEKVSGSEEKRKRLVPHGWPTQPRQLHRHWRSLVVLLFLDVLFALISLAFLVYGFTVLGHRGQSVEEHPRIVSTLLDVAALGPTIFPIVFAAVVGRTLKTILVWLLELGEKLGTLDLLAGSNTVASTIWTLYVLRSSGLIGLGLVAAWALSPVGGQASLRVVTLGDATVTNTVSLRYMSANNSYSYYVSGDLGAVRPLLFGMFNAALLGPEGTKASPTDPWNNVKIPMLEALTTGKNFGENDWLEVPDEDVTYAALIGLPVTDLPQKWKTTFSIESFYWKVDCTNLTESRQPFPAAIPESDNASTNARKGWSGETDRLGTWILTNTSGSCRGQPDDPTLGSRHFAYNSLDQNQDTFGALCTLTTTYVEVEVQCVSQDCRASRIRPSTNPSSLPNWTILDGTRAGYDCNYWLYFIGHFFDIAPVTRAQGGPIQGYLVNPELPASPNEEQAVYNVNKRDFSIRLSQLLNSFWLISAGPYAIPYGIDGDIKGSGQTAQIREAEGRAVKGFQVIKCHTVWLTFLIIASTFLLAASVLSMVLRLRWNAIELSLNVSSMTRDNPYVYVPAGGSHLDGDERSRLLRDSKVMFGDVAPQQEAGHLAIASCERFAGSAGVSEARRTRVYD